MKTFEIPEMNVISFVSEAVASDTTVDQSFSYEDED